VWVWRRSMVAAMHVRVLVGDEKMSMGRESKQTQTLRGTASPAGRPPARGSPTRPTRAKAALE
jgi:hypothetical protein